MKKWQRFLYLLLLFICLGLLVWTVVTFSPLQVLPFQQILFPVYWIFYTLLFAFFVLLGKALTKRFIHGAGIGIFLVSLLLLKTNNLFQPFLIVLLIILIIGLEVAFWQRKKKANNTPKQVAS